MVRDTALARLSKVLQTNALAATHQNVRVGTKFSIIAKKEKQRLGPYTVIDSQAKGVMVKSMGKQRSFAIDKIHLYKKY